MKISIGRTIWKKKNKDLAPAPAVSVPLLFVPEPEGVGNMGPVVRVDVEEGTLTPELGLVGPTLH